MHAGFARHRADPDRARSVFLDRLPGYALALALGPGILFFVSDGMPADFSQVLDDMQRVYAQVDHYTATFLLQERIRGDLGETQLAALKFKKPFKVSMRWLDGPNKGRQALYPAGPGDNRLLVRIPILVGAITLRLDPQGGVAMKGRRHPITDIGIGRLLEFLRESAHRGPGEGEFFVEDRGAHTTFDRPTHRYSLHSRADRLRGYDGMSAVIDVDRERHLPIYMELSDGNGQLVERYGYLDLHLNPGLTDADFDPKNPHSGF